MVYCGVVGQTATHPGAADAVFNRAWVARRNGVGQADRDQDLRCLAEFEIRPTRQEC